MSSQFDLLADQFGAENAYQSVNDYSFAPSAANSDFGGGGYGGFSIPDTWERTASDLASLYVKGAIDEKYYRPERLERLRLSALGSDGYYLEGQRNGQVQQRIPLSMLLIGAAVAFFALKG